MARLWAEKSGLPPQSEQEAMKSRLDDLKKTNQDEHGRRVSGSRLWEKRSRSSPCGWRKCSRKKALAMPSRSMPIRSSTSNPTPTRRGSFGTSPARSRTSCARILPPPTMPCLPITASAGPATARQRSAASSSSFATGKAIGSWSPCRNSHQSDFQRSILNRPTTAIGWSSRR